MTRTWACFFWRLESDLATAATAGPGAGAAPGIMTAAAPAAAGGKDDDMAAAAAILNPNFSVSFEI
jgi:hypothetical protein